MALQKAFNTTYGQEVISQSETAQDRAIREGKGVCYNFSSTFALGNIMANEVDNNA